MKDLTQLTLTCSKSTTETLKKGVNYVQNVFIVNFEHISHLFSVLLLLNLTK